MPSIHLYFPFDNWKEDKVLKNDVDGFRKSGLEFELIDRTTPSCLGGIGGEDLIIISGHGGVGSSRISMTGKGGKVRLTANDLAKLLEDDGLSKKHQSILLITCYGGGKSEVTGTDSTPLSDSEWDELFDTLPVEAVQHRVAPSSMRLTSNKIGDCLASILAKACGMRGYYSILVGGFPGSFVTASRSLGGKSGFKDQDRSAGSGRKMVLAQLDHIQWYDAKGTLQ